MHTYKVSLGSGTRTVQAESKLDAVVKATGRKADRFTQTAVDEFTETACNPGHQDRYTVKGNAACQF